jgi:hypothetical protein
MMPASGIKTRSPGAVDLYAGCGLESLEALGSHFYGIYRLG